jgi:[ribosomal protein S5]-alanine N-acetyltransferase
LLNRRIIPIDLNGKSWEWKGVSLALLGVEDCHSNYLGWLEDPQVNRYLETRHQEQSIQTIREFVDSVCQDPLSWLFKISLEGQHVGNLKLGPANPIHLNADCSYFIGDRASWGKGVATKAVSLSVWLAFEKLGLEKLTAGFYEGHVGSMKVLERSGFLKEGKMKGHLYDEHQGKQVDKITYGLTKSDWMKGEKVFPDERAKEG